LFIVISTSVLLVSPYLSIKGTIKRNYSSPDTSSK
jgi:hypothetical protein